MWMDPFAMRMGEEEQAPSFEMLLGYYLHVLPKPLILPRSCGAELAACDDGIQMALHLLELSFVIENCPNLSKYSSLCRRSDNSSVRDLVLKWQNVLEIRILLVIAWQMSLGLKLVLPVGWVENRILYLSLRVKTVFCLIFNEVFARKNRKQKLKLKVELR